jgi:16S rRNA processing protein RimM
MGRVHSPFGIKGWVNIQPYSESIDALMAFRSWWIGAREVNVLEVRRAGDHLVAQIAGCTDRDQALALRGAEIAVPRDELPPIESEEIYWDDLVGLKVVNEAGDQFGLVREVFTNGAHEVLRIVDEAGTERLIPYVAVYIAEVDMQAGLISARWQADW